MLTKGDVSHIDLLPLLPEEMHGRTGAHKDKRDLQERY
jgi:hypothetical protein